MFKVGEIIWHVKFGRGEIAYSAGSEIRVMFDDPQYNTQISTESPAYISGEDLADALRIELKKGLAEFEQEIAGQTITKEEIERLRREKVDSITRQIDSLKETSRKADVDGHTIWWDADHSWKVPTLPNGQPDPKYKYPVMSGYFTITKGTQPLGWHPDKEHPGKLKFHPIEDYLDMNLQSNTTGAKFRVRIWQRELPVLPAARSVPMESVSVLMDEDDSFGSFFDHSK
jgi:hypothetical protein